MGLVSAAILAWAALVPRFRPRRGDGGLGSCLAAIMRSREARHSRGSQRTTLAETFIGGGKMPVPMPRYNVLICSGLLPPKYARTFLLSHSSSSSGSVGAGASVFDDFLSTSGRSKLRATALIVTCFQRCTNEKKHFQNFCGKKVQALAGVFLRLLKHGEWMDQSELPFTQSTANKPMKVAACDHLRDEKHASRLPAH